MLSIILKNHFEKIIFHQKKRLTDKKYICTTITISKMINSIINLKMRIKTCKSKLTSQLLVPYLGKDAQRK